MALLRVLLPVLNVAMVVYLVYTLLNVYRDEPRGAKRNWILGIGIFLLLLPSVVLIRLVPPSTLYFLVYPVAISVLIYFIRTPS
jgi:hypothetical protein